MAETEDPPTMDNHLHSGEAGHPRSQLGRLTIRLAQETPLERVTKRLLP